MYIVFIALLYLWIMMILTAPSLGSEILLVLFGGTGLWVVYYLLNTATRRRRRQLLENAGDDESSD